MITRRAGQRCAICGVGEGREAKRWLEAHERWAFDKAAQAQTLKRLICLCTDCHTVTHFGYAQVRGTEAQAFPHLVKVTGVSESQAHRHVRGAFAAWEERSQTVWSLDRSRSVCRPVCGPVQGTDGRRRRQAPCRGRTRPVSR